MAQVKLPCNPNIILLHNKLSASNSSIACVIGSTRLGGAWHLAGRLPSPHCSRGRTPQSVGPPALLIVTYGRVSDPYKDAQRSNRNSKDPKVLKHKLMM